MAQIWMDEPEEHDYPAAESYLSLVAPPPAVKFLMDKFRKTTTNSGYKAKDILRASRLELLPKTNPHVAHNITKVNEGRPLSPVLLIRGDLGKGHNLTIADGYHRVCASYHLDENTVIPCKLITLITIESG